MNEDAIKIFVIILIPVAFLLGSYWNGSIDYKEEQANLISCDDYSEDFLEYMGHSGDGKKDSCENLNLHLHSQALDDCAERIGLVSDIGENYYQKIMDSCVYHELAGSIGVINTVGIIKYRQQ